jgi:hypothetical protein
MHGAERGMIEVGQELGLPLEPGPAPRVRLKVDPERNLPFEYGVAYHEERSLVGGCHEAAHIEGVREDGLCPLEQAHRIDSGGNEWLGHRWSGI